MEILAFDVAALAGSALKILYVALGLGLVIFFHELGHFAVAKWCGVFVERFSIGFGPILWSFKRGDTEYALSAIPFGGYVKMLGQDDMDPSQLSSDEIAEDPRSYSAKNVPQRMAIISAGVIMNIITGMLFFAGAFRLGVEANPPVAGDIITGQPAWIDGFEPGDRIARINDREIHTFNDMVRGTTLSRGAIEVSREKRDGTIVDSSLTPNMTERRRIGIGPAVSRKILAAGEDAQYAGIPGSPAADAGFEDGDLIVSVGGDAVETGAEMYDALARRRAEDVEIVVDRDGKQVSLDVKRRPFKSLGLWMRIDKILAIQKGSVAEKAGLKAGDLITGISVASGEEEDGEGVEVMDVGTMIDPMFLADVFEQHAGQEVTVHYKREVDGETEAKPKQLTLVPTDSPAWRHWPGMDDTPLEIPSIGVAYHLTSYVDYVVPGSVAEEKGLEKGTTLTSITVASGHEEFKKLVPKSSSKITLDDTQKKSMAFALCQVQFVAEPKVTITWTDQDKQEAKLEIEPTVSEDETSRHYFRDRGMRIAAETIVLQDDSVGGALAMAVRHTRNTTIDIYLTIRNLFSGDLSVKNLSGPIGIAKAAYSVTGQGMAQLLLFLGFLSINLAVLNFLPIPVLDGGHMVFLIWEGVSRRRPSEKVQIAATYVGMAFVLSLMVFVIILDLFVNRGGS